MTEPAQGSKPSTASAEDFPAIRGLPTYLLGVSNRELTLELLRSLFPRRDGRKYLLKHINYDHLVSARNCNLIVGRSWINPTNRALPLENHYVCNSAVCILRWEPTTNRSLPPTPKILMVNWAAIPLPPKDYDEDTPFGSGYNEKSCHVIWQHWEAAEGAGLSLEEWEAQQAANRALATGALANARS
jgi:hypothetical protein